VNPKLAEKKDLARAKLVTTKPSAKTPQEIAHEEYTLQLELAIENH
jgi:hypothetical protein